MIFNCRSEGKTKEKILSRIICTIIFFMLILFAWKCFDILTVTLTRGASIDLFCVIEEVVRINNTILCIMCLISGIIYYYNNKKIEILIFTVFFLTIFINIITGNFDRIALQPHVQAATINSILVTSIIIRQILMIIIILPAKKIKRAISNHIAVFTIMVVLLTLTGTLLETKTSLFYFIRNDSESLILFLELTTIIYLIAMAVCFINVIKSLEFIYIPIMICIGLFAIKLLFAFGLLIDRTLILLLNSILISVLMFLSFIFGLLIDSLIKIKKQKRLERQLQIFYHLAEKNNHIEMVILNEENKVIYVNERTLQKRSASNDTKQAYCDISKFIEENIMEELEDVFNNKVNTIDKFIKINNDKEVLKCNVQTLDLEQNCKYKSLTFTDITSTYNRNERIKISEQRLRGVTENISEIIISVDSCGLVTYVNNSCLNILSCDESDLIGNKIDDFLVEEDEALHINDVNRNVNNELIRAKMTSKNNSVKMLEITKNPIINSDGEVIGKVLIGKDLDYINEIEKLKTKYKEIQEYDRIKNEFFANLSHELRTPINIIYSCLQLLTTFSKKDNEEFKNYYIKYSKTLKQNCFRMMRIVNNLIDITKIESGFMKMDFQNYDIVSLVENITLSVIPYVESKKLNITFDTDVEELEIKCDPDKIERVILNLLSNAIKFSNIGGNILVDMSEKNDKVYIRVKDDGIGIPANMRDVVFKRFIQTDKSFRRAKEGSGIGLALVKSLVELHNGEIYLEKNIDEGSEFVIILPNEKIESDIEEANISYYESQVESISIEFADIYDIN